MTVKEEQTAWEGKFKDVFVACDTLNETLGSALYELGRRTDLRGDTKLVVSVTVGVEPTDQERVNVRTLEDKAREYMMLRQWPRHPQGCLFFF